MARASTKRQHESGGDEFCPVRATLDLLNRKWTLHVVHELVAGKKRFNELAAALGGVNPRTLSKRLDELEADGLLTRRMRSAIPPWTEYELTTKGRSLRDMMQNLGKWGRRWMTPSRTETA